MSNIESIFGKMEQDGNLGCLYEALEGIMRKETEFAIKGKVRRVKEAKIEVAWVGFEVVS